MTRKEIMTEARLLLNEITAGFWSNDGLYLYGWEGEKELVNLLPEEFSQSLLKTEPAYATVTLPLNWIDGNVHPLPADFLRFKSARGIGSVKRFYQYVPYNDLSLHSLASNMPYYSPGTGGSPSVWIYSWHSYGLLLSPATASFELIYYRIPTKWASANENGTPELNLITHDILVDHITWKALLDDGEFESATKFKDRKDTKIKVLGGLA